MKVIYIRVHGSDFELGRVLQVPPGGTIELDPAVPTGDRRVPFFWLKGAAPEPFATRVRNHPSTSRLEQLVTLDDRTLFAFDFAGTRDHLFEGIDDQYGQIQAGKGSEDGWCFEIRFPSHEEVTRFQTHCENARIRLTLDRINSQTPGSEHLPGLTEAQVEALTLAVRTGYYDVPRGTTLEGVAADLGISDQAASERIRRGTKAVITNVLLSQNPPVEQRQ